MAKIRKQRAKGITCLVFSAMLLVLYPASSYAADMQFEATIDRSRVSLGSSLQLNLSFHGTQNISAPDIGNIEGFKVRYLGPSTRVSIINSRMSASITHIYTLTPLKTGTFQIGPLSIIYKGETLASKPLSVEVVSGSSAPQKNLPRQESKQERLNQEELKNRIFLTIETGKSRVYLNEIIPLTIKLRVNRLAVRDIRYPQVSSEGFSLEEFGRPRQYRENLGGLLYDVIEFHTNMFAVKPGKLNLGPAKLNANLLIRKQRRSARSDDFFGGTFNSDIFDNFFDSYKTYPLNISAPQAFLTVMPLPRENRPSNFKGAVGNFQLEAEASPKEVKAGDPVTLTMKISGKGNFDTVSSPVLESKERFKVYEPQVKQENNTRVFEQVLIPQSANIAAIPAVKFSFFDPATETYRTLTRGPFAITVKKPVGGELKIVEGSPAVTRFSVKENLGRDIVYIKESPGRFRAAGEYLYKKTGYRIFNIAVFVIFIVASVFYRHSARLKTDLRYARRLAAPGKAKKGIRQAQRLLKQGNTKEFLETAFKTMREYLGDKFHLSGGAVTVDIVEQTLKPRGIDGDILEKLKEIFVACDLARYAPSQFDHARTEGIFRDIREVIDYLEKRKF